MRRIQSSLSAFLCLVLLLGLLSPPALAAGGSSPEAGCTRAGLAELIYANESLKGLIGSDTSDAGFADIRECTDDQKNAINALANAGVLSGTSETTFDPDGTVTRAEAVVVIWRAAGCKSNPTPVAEMPYSDITGTEWYAPAVLSLTAAGIIRGQKDGQFDANGLATEAMVVALLARFSASEGHTPVDTAGWSTGVTRLEMLMAAYENYKDSPVLQAAAEAGRETAYADIAACTAEEQEAVQFFTKLGVVSGYNPDNEGGVHKFGPDAAASNLQIAMFLMRCAQLDEAAQGDAAQAENQSLTMMSAAPEAQDDPLQDRVEAAFGFLTQQGVDVTAAKANPHAPGLTGDVSAWNEALVPEAPSFSPAGGSFTGSQTVTISADEGSALYYTTDGSAPTTASTLYTAPLTVSATTTVRAIAVKNNLVSAVAGATYTAGGSDSGSSGGSGSTTTTTERNPDGSTTTTTTNHATGTVTETTRYPDGSREVVETRRDGTVTTTAIDADGNRTETVERPDGSAAITVDRADGSGSVTTVDEAGRTTVRVSLPARAVDGAGAAAVTLPMPAVGAGTDCDGAPAVTVSLPGGAVPVEIPVVAPAVSTVAVLVRTDGSQEILRTGVTTANGVAVTLRDGDTVRIVDNAKSFDDVPAGHWAAEAIAFTASRELFSGTGTAAFSPEAAMSRAMIVTVLARLEGVDTAGGEPWYATGRQWAMEAGISDGTNMAEPLTREQLAAMLWRYAGQPAAASALTGYTDAGSVSAYAADAMAWAVEQGLIGGTAPGLLRPQAPATRAQVATILMRFCQSRTA